VWFSHKNTHPRIRGLEQLIVAYLFKTIIDIYEIRSFTSVFPRTRHWSYVCQMESSYILFKTYFNIILPNFLMTFQMASSLPFPSLFHSSSIHLMTSMQTQTTAGCGSSAVRSNHFQPRTSHIYLLLQTSYFRFTSRGYTGREVNFTYFEAFNM
jgi:hypothetical protein